MNRSIRSASAVALSHYSSSGKIASSPFSLTQLLRKARFCSVASCLPCEDLLHWGMQRCTCAFVSSAILNVTVCVF
jgi:hypothetical protein